MNRRTLARLVAAAGLAAAVSIGMAGPAAALPPPGADDRGAVDEREQPGPETADPDPAVEDPGPVTGNPDPRTTNPGPVPDTTGGAPTTEQAGPHASAPTANLRKLADALVVEHEGIYLDITAPPGLGVGPIEISIGFGPERFTGTTTTPPDSTGCSASSRSPQRRARSR